MVEAVRVAARAAEREAVFLRAVREGSALPLVELVERELLPVSGRKTIQVSEAGHRGERRGKPIFGSTRYGISSQRLLQLP